MELTLEKSFDELKEDNINELKSFKEEIIKGITTLNEGELTQKEISLNDTTENLANSLLDTVELICDLDEENIELIPEQIHEINNKIVINIEKKTALKIGENILSLLGNVKNSEIDKKGMLKTVEMTVLVDDEEIVDRVKELKRIEKKLIVEVKKQQRKSIKKEKSNVVKIETLKEETKDFKEVKKEVEKDAEKLVAKKVGTDFHVKKKYVPRNKESRPYIIWVLHEEGKNLSEIMQNEEVIKRYTFKGGFMKNWIRNDYKKITDPTV